MFVDSTPPNCSEGPTFMRRPRNHHLNGNPGSNPTPHGRNDNSDSHPRATGAEGRLSGERHRQNSIKLSSDYWIGHVPLSVPSLVGEAVPILCDFRTPDSRGHDASTAE